MTIAENQVQTILLHHDFQQHSPKISSKTYKPETQINPWLQGTFRFWGTQLQTHNFRLLRVESYTRFKSIRFS